MRSLILMRHGTAEKAAASGTDFDRPLTERGRRDAEAAGEALAENGWVPTVALVSPALRTQETWEEVESAFADVEKRDERALLHTTAETILAAAEAAEGEVVMVVGHNPGIADLMDALSRTGDEASRRDYLRGGCPPGAAAVFSVEDGRYSLEDYIAPERRPVSRIYKILDRAVWEAAQAAGRFDGAEIDLKDGYIHFSTAGQAGETARLHFKGREGLVVLEIEAESLGEALKWEASRGGQLFPHLYGPLDTGRVLAVHVAPLGGDGAPILPPLSP